jgi:DNA-binding Xre family transcriptional regulator
MLFGNGGLLTVFRLREVMEGVDPALSIRRVALDAGLTYETVHNVYQNKTARVDLETLDALASALGCEPGELIGKGDKVGRGKRPSRGKARAPAHPA